MSNEMWLRVLMIFIGIVIIYNIFTKPLYEIKGAAIAGVIIFAVLWMFTKSVRASACITTIVIFLSFVGFEGDIINNDNRTIVYKEKKKTRSEKRAEKKAKEKAYWQYVSDVEDEAILYED